MPTQRRKEKRVGECANAQEREGERGRDTVIRVLLLLVFTKASQVTLMVKNPPANVGDIRDPRVHSIPGLGRFPQKRAWQPTPVFLPGASHGQRSLVGYSP